jgi:hypothetical protein
MSVLLASACSEGDFYVNGYEKYGKLKDVFCSALLCSNLFSGHRINISISRT